MPRRTRYILPNIPHHAIHRGNNRQHVFFDDEDYKRLLTCLKTSARRENVSIGAYCLMSNHIHLLLYPQTENGLINLMKYVAQLYSQYSNRKYRRSGKLWENRYKLHIVDPEYVWCVARYIERNPVKAGIAGAPEDYPYSSAQAHMQGVGDETVTIDILKERNAEYMRFVLTDDATTQKQDEMLLKTIKQGKAFGHPDFIQALEDRFSAPFHVRRRGRPVK